MVSSHVGHLWSPAYWTPLKHVVDCMSGTVVLRDSLVCLKLTIINIFKREVKALIWWKSLVLVSLSIDLKCGAIIWPTVCENNLQKNRCFPWCNFNLFILNKLPFTTWLLCDLFLYEINAELLNGVNSRCYTPAKVHVGAFICLYGQIFTCL